MHKLGEELKMAHYKSYTCNCPTITVRMSYRPDDAHGHTLLKAETVMHMWQSWVENHIATIPISTECPAGIYTIEWVEG